MLNRYAIALCSISALIAIPLCSGGQFDSSVGFPFDELYFADRQTDRRTTLDIGDSEILTYGTSDLKKEVVRIKKEFEKGHSFRYLPRGAGVGPFAFLQLDSDESLQRTRIYPYSHHSISYSPPPPW